MARAVLFHGVGQPLELAEFPVPEPASAAVLVRVTCCTLCRSDLHTHSGRRPGPVPMVLGHEIVGRIAAFGPDALRVDARGAAASVGDRVTWCVTAGCGACFFCQDDLPQKCPTLHKYGHTAGQPFAGGLADYVLLVPGTTWLRVPDVLSDAVAAPANCATATVAGLLRHGGDIAERNILILGAGVLGATACAMARASGARAVIASDPDPALRQRALAFGATHAVSGDAGEQAAALADLTEGRGADVVLELAGVKSSVQAGLALVRMGGTLVLAGTVAPVGTVEVDPEQLVRRMLTIRGVHNYHPRDLATALDFLAGPGQDYPFGELTARTFPLVEAEAAFSFAHGHPGQRVAVVP